MSTILNFLKENYKVTFPIHLDDFSQFAYFALQRENKVSLTNYVDIDQNIANKIINSRDNLNDLGYFIGSLMLVVTGFTSILLAVKEIKNPGNSTHWLSVFFTVLRRTFLFLNLMLSTLVIGVLTRLITF